MKLTNVSDKPIRSEFYGYGVIEFAVGETKEVPDVVAKALLNHSRWYDGKPKVLPYTEPVVEEGPIPEMREDEPPVVEVVAPKTTRKRTKVVG